MKKKPNREYKDTVFVDLFSKDKNANENFILLYNALHDTNLPLDTKLENIQLEHVLYTGLRNDISFLLDNKLIVLAEHQSTVNENMPLRFLEYVARLYEKTQEPKNRYLRKPVKIPTPEFYVFYNGEADYPAEKTLKLSDAFLDKNKDITLELAVKVFNINKDKNNPLLKKCKRLDEYSTFIEEARRLHKIDPEHGFETAIKECISKGILKDYLKRKNMEVNNMLVAEYDYALDIAVQREEAGREAFEQGISQGISQGITQNTLKTIENMRNENCDNEFISKITGLSVEEIKKLKP
ncbi:MAG: hypothetical protein CR988_00075 [Treponema sp.]|nr:MAG: hypothetical protein CR988_00075 [Treponema sp.]